MRSDELDGLLIFEPAEIRSGLIIVNGAQSVAVLFLSTLP